MKFIGLDLGTSFIKGAVLDLDSYRLEHIQRVPFPGPVPGLPPLFREYDPAQIVAGVRQLLDVLASYGDGCGGIVMCSQMHGTIFTTEHGEPRSNFLTWQDQRVLMPHPSGRGTFFEVMKEQLAPHEISRLGDELRPGLAIGQLTWFAAQPERPTLGLIPASLPDFVIANLCESMPVTEVTHAAAHGLLNVEKLEWHAGVLDKLGLGRFRLPEIRQHGDVAGYLKLRGDLVPCYTPVGDYQCALLGSLLQKGELSLNISTGSQVSLLTPSAIFGNFETRPYFDGRYTITVTHIPAGRALDGLTRLLGELAGSQGFSLADPWPYIVQQAEKVEQPSLQVDLSFYHSAVGDQGHLSNVRESELTVGHLFRAAFQNMTDNYYVCARRLSPDEAWDNLVFSGGLAQKISLLRSMISRKFGARYRLSPHLEDTLFGLLALALAFCGRAPSVGGAAAMLYGAQGTGMLIDPPAD